jgi:hypothetical protein
MLKGCRKTPKPRLRTLVGVFDHATADRKVERSATIEYAAPVADHFILQSII